METNDVLIYTTKYKNVDEKEQFEFFQKMDEYDKFHTDNYPTIKNNYVCYGYSMSRKGKKIDFLVTTSKLKEVFWYFTCQMNIQITKEMELFIFERRNQFIIEIYDNNELFAECCVRKLTREGLHLLNTLKGDMKLTASPYSQNLKFINFLMNKSV